MKEYHRNELLRRSIATKQKNKNETRKCKCCSAVPVLGWGALKIAPFGFEKKVTKKYHLAPQILIHCR
jgi:hypothetical protein